MILSQNCIVVALIIVSLLTGCCGADKQQTRPAETNTLTTLEDSWSELESDTNQEMPDKTLTLAEKICPALMKTLKERYERYKYDKGYWHLNHLAADIDGDHQNEHILLFWDGCDFCGILCILKKSGSKWKVMYSDLIQKWAYCPPSFLVIGNHSKCKRILCTYESITHATGLYENRYRVLSMVDGHIKVLFDIPREFHNYCMTFKSTLCQHGEDDLELNFNYAYFYNNGLMPDSVIFEGSDSVLFEWNNSTNTFS